MATSTGHCSVNQKKLVRDKVRAPWYNEELRSAKVDLRRQERELVSKPQPLEVDRQMFTKARNAYNRLCDETRSQCHRGRIEGTDQRTLFAVIDDLTGDKRSCSIMP